MGADLKKLKNPKVQRIIACALQLLRDHGDHGLTMRQVAVCAEMSLSNVQYYFKNKNALLKGVVAYYFEECAASLRDHMAKSAGKSVREQVAAMFEYMLVNDTAPAICMIFREVWAIASRNEEVDAYMKGYYAELAETLSGTFAHMGADDKAAAKAASLMLPYLEGYSISGACLPLNRDEVTAMLMEIIMSMLGEQA